MENSKTRAYILTKIDKTLENNTDEIDSHKIYTSMSRMSNNAESPRRSYGDSSQLTNCILGSGVTHHKTSLISDFIPGSLVETDKHI